jgi:hypothetical protein
VYLSKRLVWTLILAGMTATPAATVHARAGDEPDGREDPTDERASSAEWLGEGPHARGRRALEGSWAITITPVVPPGVPPPPPFRGYWTFARGGAFIGSSRGNPLGNQHGAWAYNGDGEFAYTFMEDRFDAAGRFQGTTKVRGTRLTFIGRNEFVAVSSGETRDAEGNLVAIRCSVVRGVRIRIEPLPPECEGIEPPQ